jgi:hypothetical protein
VLAQLLTFTMMYTHLHSPSMMLSRIVLVTERVEGNVRRAAASASSKAATWNGSWGRKESAATAVTTFLMWCAVVNLVLGILMSVRLQQ